MVSWKASLFLMEKGLRGLEINDLPNFIFWRVLPPKVSTKHQAADMGMIATTKLGYISVINKEVYAIDPYHPNIPSQAQMQLRKQILRGFQNALEYLREMEFTICECIPYTLPLQHSADKLWGICVHDDAHVSYLKKKSRTTSTSTSAEQCWLFGYLLPKSCMSISLFYRFNGEYSLCFWWWIMCQDLCISHLYNLSVLCVCVGRSL